ncbi:uncharacterized protein TRIADDRAFT_60093 [Trichoplax adhaerens]|uniref:Uncharacterized protein n=1 Tax=Trichoplax adhaerens TaxID=10228 RepID=B3S7A2_TRIAD|nr:predicted protein [Trichoplax adhaerens]EDV21452.1 predicted protein [Trichoplax adhaerens]|eukprot:XP_002116052.1 predicted protein [Trichoplax adhaerens]
MPELCFNYSIRGFKLVKDKKEFIIQLMESYHIICKIESENCDQNDGTNKSNQWSNWQERYNLVFAVYQPQQVEDEYKTPVISSSHDLYQEENSSQISDGKLYCLAYNVDSVNTVSS